MVQTPIYSRLKLRQKKYLEGLSLGKSRRQALDYAGYSENTRPNAIENPSVKAAFTRILQRAVPINKLAATLAEGLQATETKYFANEGKIVDSATGPNYSERRQYAKLVAEYAEYVEPESSQIGGSTLIQVMVGEVGATHQLAQDTKGENAGSAPIQGTVAAQTEVVVAKVE